MTAATKKKKTAATAEDKILAVLRKSPQMTQSELVTTTGEKRSRVRSAIKRLVEAKQIVKKGSGYALPGVAKAVKSPKKSRKKGPKKPKVTDAAKQAATEAKERAARARVQLLGDCEKAIRESLSQFLPHFDSDARLMVDIVEGEISITSRVKGQHTSRSKLGEYEGRKIEKRYHGTTWKAKVESGLVKILSGTTADGKDAIKAAPKALRDEFGKPLTQTQSAVLIVNLHRHTTGKGDPVKHWDGVVFWGFDKSPSDA